MATALSTDSKTIWVIQEVETFKSKESGDLSLTSGGHLKMSVYNFVITNQWCDQSWKKTKFKCFGMSKRHICNWYPFFLNCPCTTIVSQFVPVSEQQTADIPALAMVNHQKNFHVVSVICTLGDKKESYFPPTISFASREGLTYTVSPTWNPAWKE